MKILIAVDGSSHTKRMLAHLAAYDEWRAGTHEFTVFHTVLPVPSRAASFVDANVVKNYYLDEAQKVFSPIRKFFDKQGIDATFVHKVGHPAAEIANLATKGKFDILMLGTHGHGSLGNLIMGSVATKVLGLCTTPVLLVR